MPITTDSQDFLSLPLTHITQITMVYQTVHEDGDYTTIDIIAHTVETEQ